MQLTTIILIIGILSLLVFIKKMYNALIETNEEIIFESKQDDKSVSKYMNADDKGFVTLPYQIILDLITSSKEMENSIKNHSLTQKKINDIVEIEKYKDNKYNSEPASYN